MFNYLPTAGLESRTLTMNTDPPPMGVDSSEPSATTITVVATSPNQPPPMRFGASRVVIEPDPDRSTIKIHEIQRDEGYPDYRIFIMHEIRDQSSYYAELITLLNTLTPESNVTVYIGSNGGSLNGGAMIANAISLCKATVTTIALGVVASSAALIWSYGHKRQVVVGSQVMFHMSSHGAWGNSEEIRQMAEFTVRYVKEVCIDPLVAQGIITLEESELIIDKRRDLWLDADTLTARLNKTNG